MKYEYDLVNKDNGYLVSTYKTREAARVSMGELKARNVSSHIVQKSYSLVGERVVR